MKNVIICKTCDTENSFHQLTCKNCKEYLRERIINIDFWSTLWKLIESPSKAFSNIIHSEHKNFVIVLIFLLSIKFFINSLILTNALSINTSTLDYLVYNSLTSLLYVIVIVHLFAFIVTYLNILLGIDNRFKDNVTVYLYSAIPFIIGGIILFVVEYALFGHYFISFYPSPYLLNKNVAYILTGLEGIILLWSLSLSIIGSYVQTKNIFYSILLGVSYWAILLYAMAYFPYFPML